MSNEKIKSILKEILSDLEIRVYLAALEGPLTISQLAKKANVNRSGTYRIVENLVNKGLLSKELKMYGQHIVAEHPKKVLQLLANSQRKFRRKELEFEQLMPELVADFNTGENKSSIKIYEGRDGLENAYNLMLEECHDTQIQALSGDMELVLNVFDIKFWRHWNAKIFAKNNTARMIVNDSEQARHFKHHNDSEKFITKIIPNFKLQTDINIFNDKVLIVSFKDKIATLIFSKSIADSYRILFENVWEKNN